MSRKKAVWMLGLFLALILLFTVLSRAADSLTLAQVTLQKPGKQVITHRVTGNGRVAGAQEEAVFTEPGQKVKKIYVEEGEGVEEGETLLQVDMDTLKEAIQTKERELAAQELTWEDAASQKAATQEKKSRSVSRAWQDYQDAEASADAAVAAAQEEVDVAYERLQEFYDSQKGFQNAAEEGQDSGALEALEDALRQARQALEEARRQREESLKAAQRNIEDAQAEEGQNTQEQREELTRQEKEKELLKLKRLEEQGGKLLAPMDGIVTEWKLQTGEVTSEGAALLMVDTKTAFRFEGTFTEEDEEYIEKGAAVTLEGNQELSELEELTVSGVETAENEAGELVRYLVVDLPGQVSAIGATATFTVEKDSPTYNTCVPVSALRMENNRYFVYVAEEENGVLGESLTARKVEVTVVEQNEQYAALSDNSLSTSQQVIVSTDREIEDGSRIREREAS